MVTISRGKMYSSLENKQNIRTSTLVRRNANGQEIHEICSNMLGVRRMQLKTINIVFPR